MHNGKELDFNPWKTGAVAGGCGRGFRSTVRKLTLEVDVEEDIRTLKLL
jgi:hypothetical protein